MQDLKHITRKKSFLSALRSLRHRNRRLLPPSVDDRDSSSPLRRPRLLRPILTLIAVVLALYPIAGLVVDNGKRFISYLAPSPSSPGERTPPLTAPQSFGLAASSLDRMTVRNNRCVTVTPRGEEITLSLLPELQEKMKSYLAANRVPFALFIAMEPSTGKVLAMTSHSEVDPEWEGRAFYDLYPMASLFKIITASAALEQKKVDPDTVIEFRGKLTSENPRYWAPGKRKNNQMELDLAMGKSVNPVFGRLANDIVGKETLLSYTERFGFNQTLFPDTPIPPSRAEPPQTPEDVMLMGAGLGREVKLSPFHAAAIIASIANQGTMMAPILAESVTSREGKTVFTSTPHELRRIVSPQTAEKLSRMLVTTVRSGTSRRAFHDRRGRTLLGPLTIAAKTGSITGTSPPGQYSWFAAYAPVERPRIALVALVINQKAWKIKASHVGEKGLETFFRE